MLAKTPMAAPSLSRTMTVCFSRHTQPFESAGQSRVRSQEAREAHSDGSPARVTSEMQAVQAFDASDTPSLLVLGDTGSSTPVGGRQSVSAWVFGTVLRSVVQRRSSRTLTTIGSDIGKNAHTSRRRACRRSFALIESRFTRPRYKSRANVYQQTPEPTGLGD